MNLTPPAIPIIDAAIQFIPIFRAKNRVLFCPILNINIRFSKRSICAS